MVDALYLTDLMNVGRINSEYVQLVFEVSIKVLETRQGRSCRHDEEPPTICVIRNQVNQAVEKCQSIPFMYQRLLPADDNSLLPICNSSLYETCGAFLQENLDNYKCACTDQCQHTFYTSKLYSEISNREWSDLQFAVEFPAHNTAPYINVEVAVQNTFKQFLGQLGGSLGVYLGLSGLSVCTLIVVCTQMIKGQGEKSANESKHPDQEPQSSVTEQQSDGGIRGMKMRNRMINDTDDGYVTRQDFLALTESQNNATKEFITGIRDEIAILASRIDKLERVPASSRRVPRPVYSKIA